MRLVLKVIHNEQIAVLWAFLVEVVVHGLFAMQAFLLGGFLGDLALSVVFGVYLGTQIGAWSLALFVFGAAFVSFVLGQYLKEHVFAFVRSGKGDQTYIKALEETRRMAICLELSSLAYRVLTVGLHDHDWVSAIVIFVAGIVGLRYAIKMAMVIHASVNRPIEHDLARSQHQAGMTLAEKAMKYTKDMSPEQLARYSDGDVSALQEVAGNGFFEEEQRRQAKLSKKQAKLTKRLEEQQKEEANKERQNQAAETAKRLLNPSNWKRNKTPEYVPFLDAQNNPGHHLSQNGTH